MRTILISLALTASVTAGQATPATASSLSGCHTPFQSAAAPLVSASFETDAKWASPVPCSALSRLLTAEAIYARALSENEIDHGGVAEPADVTAAEHVEHRAFARTLQTIIKGEPGLEFVDFALSDGALNAAYTQVMAVPEPSKLGWGTVDKDGIRRTQRAWLVYRDAFVAFAEAVRPDAATALKAELTTRRAMSLEAFLED